MANGLRARFFPTRPVAGMAGSSPSKETARIGALDGIRGIAVMLVVIAHCKWELPPWASAGVDIFFILSGYLITAILLEECVTYGRFSFKSFYARRFLRL